MIRGWGEEISKIYKFNMIEMPERSGFYNSKLTLPDILKRAAATEGAFIGFIDEKGHEDKITYAELLSEATTLAKGLVNKGVKPGDKVIIATDANKQTLKLLWGCFLCGAIPTVLQPPLTYSGYNPPVVKLINVSMQLNNPLVFMSKIPTGEGVPVLNYITAEMLNCTGQLPEINLDPNDIAFIQFSSGSTGDSKGILLSHFNIMVNLDAITVGLNFHPNEVTGNWMPLFHDMGLIGYHLTPLYCRIIQWHIETIDFIKNPGLWLDLLTLQKVKITGCPNFGLALTLRFLKRMKSTPSWDFIHLEGILNGAEPISVQIMNDFVKALEPYNFRPEAMMPVYGLAEATLAATFTPLMATSVVTAFDNLSLDRDDKAIEVETDAENARLLAGVGVPLNDIYIRIVDDNNTEVPEGKAGVICLKGDSITRGYFNRPEETEKSFIDGWFSTGDIGFFYKGNYYISGRKKDIIFRNGRHYFANDLEELATKIDDISYGKICFAGTTNRLKEEEKVIAFLAGSAGEKAMETLHQLRNLLRSTLGITLDELVMVRSNEIPKTSSGKLQRYKLVQRYLAGDFHDNILR